MVLRTTTWMVLAFALVGLVACGGGSTDVELKGAPEIVQIEPETGGVEGGVHLTILGRWFTNDELGVTEVLVGGRPAESVVVHSDNEITCTTPAGVEGPCAISVTKNLGTGVMEDAFTYYPLPMITDVTPNQASRDGGFEVTVKGMYFMNTEPGETRVEFAGIPGLFVEVLDDETIMCRSPVAPFEEVVAVSVVNHNGEYVRNQSFKFLGHLPVVEEISPTLAPGDGGTPVTITGDQFTTDAEPFEVLFGGIPATDVVRVNDQQLTCMTPLMPDVGTVDVQVVDVNGTSRQPHTFTFFAPPMDVYSCNPPALFPGLDEPVEILGYGFERYGAGTPVVTFGEYSPDDVTVVDDGTLSCTLPSDMPLGVYDVTVTNDRGTDTIEAGFELGWTPEWIEEIGTMLEFPDATASYSSELTNLQVAMPITFPFKNGTYTDCYVRSAGWISFGGMSDNYSYYSADAHQIGVCGYYHTYGYNGDDPEAGVYATSAIDDFFVVTWNNTTWYGYDGAMYAQLQMHKSGAYALVFHEDLDQYSSMYVSSIHYRLDPDYEGYSSVTWTTEPSVGANRSAYDYVYDSDGFAGNALIFWPDGAGGYTTEFKELD